jgi:hypothetical protein
MAQLPIALDVGPTTATRTDMGTTTISSSGTGSSLGPHLDNLFATLGIMLLRQMRGAPDGAPAT